MTPQLYEAINAKLLRIGDWIFSGLFWHVRDEKGYYEILQAAYRDIERCRKEVKYEYLGLRDSWL